MTSKFCPQCGHPAGPSARFCENCGSTLSGAQPASTTNRPSVLPESPQPNRQSAAAPPADPRVRPASLPERGKQTSAPVGVGWRPASGSIGSTAPTAEKPSSGPAIPVPMFSKTKIVGYVRGLSQRFAQQNMQIYSFRVETYDAQGNRQPPVTVEMQGLSFEGSLNEGDQVEIDHKPRPGKAIKIKALMNLTSGAVFKAKGLPLYVQIINVPATLMAWIIWAAVLIGFFSLVIAIISDAL